MVRSKLPNKIVRACGRAGLVPAAGTLLIQVCKRGKSSRRQLPVGRAGTRVALWSFETLRLKHDRATVSVHSIRTLFGSADGHIAVSVRSGSQEASRHCQRGQERESFVAENHCHCVLVVTAE